MISVAIQLEQHRAHKKLVLELTREVLRSSPEWGGETEEELNELHHHVLGCPYCQNLVLWMVRAKWRERDKEAA